MNLVCVSMKEKVSGNDVRSVDRIRVTQTLIALGWLDVCLQV